MHPEIEKLIEMALADGKVTDKEREIIIRKALKLSIDEDEVEMYLEGKISNNSNETITTYKSNRESVLIKCPECGAILKSFTTNCLECGHEFRNSKASNLINKLKDDFKEIEVTCKDEYYKNGSDKTVIPGHIFNKKETVIQKSQDQIELEIDTMIAKRKEKLLTGLPIPNTKEDILEILSIGVPEVQKKLSWNERLGFHPKNILKKAWLAKCEQVIMKAKLSMKNDETTLLEIKNYEKQLKS